MLNLRKLVALDLFAHGPRFILVEFSFGILFPLILVLLSLRDGGSSPSFTALNSLLDVWLIGISANYVPPLMYAVMIIRGGTAESEARFELGRVNRYKIQQLLIFVPFLFLAIAIFQEATGPKNKPGR